MKLMVARLPGAPSFRDAPPGAGPESITTIGSMDSGLATLSRPGMTSGEIEAYASSTSPSSSIRLRQAEHFLGHKTQDQLRADRGDARDQGFAQVTFDMEFLGVAEAAMGHHRLLAGVEAGFGGEVFR